jgi:hypothetical protein
LVVLITLSIPAALLPPILVERLKKSNRFQQPLLCNKPISSIENITIVIKREKRVSFGLTIPLIG